MEGKELKDYLDANYGKCRLNPCLCKDQHNPRFGGAWVGKMCPDWAPTGASTWEELRQYMLKETTNGLDRSSGNTGQVAS